MIVEALCVSFGSVSAFHVSSFTAKNYFSSFHFYPMLTNTSKIILEHSFLSMHQAPQNIDYFIWSAFRVIK